MNEPNKLKIHSKAQALEPMDDDYMRSIKRENIEFDSWLLEKEVSYA